LQRAHAGPDFQHGIERLTCERVDFLAPVVVHGGLDQLAFVGDEFFVKEIAAVKSVLAQHALTPGIDGVNRRLVHRFGRHCKQPRGFAARGFIGVVGEQRIQKRIGLALWIAEMAGGFQKARADAVGKLARGCAGEGHHQNFGRRERTRKAVFATVAKHEAHIERRDRPGLARASACLDQSAAPEREGRRFKPRAHGCSSVWVMTSMALIQSHKAP